MGLAPLPEVRDYWNKKASVDDMLENRWIASRMSRDRWKQIYSNLSIDVEETIKFICLQSKKFYKPSSHVSIDESLIAFKGRYKYRQHIRGKPKATGLKVLY